MKHHGHPQILICIDRVLISTWVFSLLLSPSEAQCCLDLAGEACALLGSPESCGPANLMGRGPLADCHGVVYVRLLSAAIFVVFFPRPSPFLLFLLPPISTSPLTLAALGARETRGLLAGDFCCPVGSWQGWLIPNILPCDPERIPPIQGQGWGLSLPQSQPAPCLLPSEHRSRRDETKPYRSHCLSDYKVPLIEGATNARKRLC